MRQPSRPGTSLVLCSRVIQPAYCVPATASRKLGSRSSTIQHGAIAYFHSSMQHRSSRTWRWLPFYSLFRPRSPADWNSCAEEYSKHHTTPTPRFIVNGEQDKRQEQMSFSRQNGFICSASTWGSNLRPARAWAPWMGRADMGSSLERYVEGR